MNTSNPIFFATIEWIPATDGGRPTPPSGIGRNFMAPARFGRWEGNSPDEASFTLVVEMVEKVDAHHWNAKVSYLVPDAPHYLLQYGATFELYEGRRCVGRGTIGESATLHST